MINWPQLLFNLPWLLGLALILAALSYVDWQAHTRGARARDLLGASAFQSLFSAGLGLVSLSLFFLGHSWLERVLWAIFTALFAWQAWNLRR